MDLVGCENQGVVNRHGKRGNVDYLRSWAVYETDLSDVAKKQHFFKRFLVFFDTFRLTINRFWSILSVLNR